MLEAVEQGQLVEEDRARREPPGADEAAGGDRAVGVEDALELTVEGLDGRRAERVEDPADLDAVIGMRVGAAPCAWRAGPWEWVSPSTNRTACGRASSRRGAISLSAALAGGSSAAGGIQTAATVTTGWSFQP